VSTDASEGSSQLGTATKGVGMPPTLGAARAPRSGRRPGDGSSPPPRRCGGGLDLGHHAMSPVKKKGAAPIGGNRCRLGSQGLGGITCAAGPETTFGRFPVYGLELHAQVLFVRICGDTQKSLRLPPCVSSKAHEIERETPESARIPLRTGIDALSHPCDDGHHRTPPGSVMRRDTPRAGGMVLSGAGDPP
jgi:hypothetical protein